MFHTQDYSYILPPERIASTAIQPQHNAKLMIVEKDSWVIMGESTFWDLDSFLEWDRVLFFNNSRVMRARVPLVNREYHKESGEKGIIQKGEIFYLKKDGDNEFEALIRPWNKFKVGNVFQIGKYTLKIVGTTQAGRRIHISSQENETWDIIANFLEEHGQLPLPPYIEYSPEKEKDYQTSFSKKEWSVAAPTASLHFTEELLQKIKNPKKYLTLHVGLGTFKWIDTDDIRDYTIHEEDIEIEKNLMEEIATLKINNKKIVAVGTTACRTLESLPSLWKQLTQEVKDTYRKEVYNWWEHQTEKIWKNEWIQNIRYTDNEILFSTCIYITPGYQFAVVDELITNFHLPESSLLVLVSALVWHDQIMKVYHEAIQKEYRFYSFGDGMYIRWKK